MAETFEQTWRMLVEQDIAPRLQLDVTWSPQALTVKATPSSQGVAPAPARPAATPLATLPPVPLVPSDTDGHLVPDLVEVGAVGQGGMGQVALMRQHSLRRDVAVKRLLPGLSEAEAAQGAQLLLEEARLTGGLEHPNIVPVHALVRGADGGPQLVMKKLDGVDWSLLLADRDHPAWKSRPGDRLVRNLEILLQVCNATHFAHSHGVIHRDIKPANVLVGSFGEVYLVDWGLALRLGPDRAVVAPELAGTPSYLAPEMVRGHALTPATDVYLLGGLLFEVLSGHAPHCCDTVKETLEAAYLGACPRLDPTVPRELSALCERAMHSDPSQRFASAVEFKQAVADFLQHRSSLQLSQESAARLTYLRAAFEDPSAVDEARLRKLGAECRFGFQQALRTWPENRAARSGLQACLEALIEHELVAGNAGAAEALLAELPEPRPPLAERVAFVRGQQESDAQAAHRLSAFERDHDLGHGWSRRGRVMGAVELLLSAVALTGWLLERAGHFHLTVAGMMATSAFALVELAVATAIWFPQMITNRAGRQFIGLMVACSAFTGLNAGLGLLHGLDIHGVWAMDLQLMIFLAVCLALLHTPRVVLASVPTVACLAWDALRPQDLMLNMACTMLYLALLFFFTPSDWVVVPTRRD